MDSESYMRGFIRITLKSIILIALVLAIYWNIEPDSKIFPELASYAYTFMKLLNIACGWIVLAFRYLTFSLFFIIILFVALTILFLIIRYNIIVSTKVEALSSTAWELIRLMENCSSAGWQSRLALARETTKQFAVEGAERLGSSQHSFINDIDSSHVGVLKAVSDDIVDRWWKDAASYRSYRSSVRNGVSILLHIMSGRPDGAYTGMIDHMREQLKKPDWHNFDSLKEVLYITTEQPTSVSVKKYQLAGLTPIKYFLITRAASKRHQILDGLTFNPEPPEGKEPIVITGENILLAMRTFLRTTDTYDERLGS